MQMDTENFIVVVSKAQGCDETIGLDPKFLGWAREYTGPFYGEAWQKLDTDVDRILLEVRRGEESDEDDIYEIDENENSDKFLQKRLEHKSNPYSFGQRCSEPCTRCLHLL